MGSSQSDRIKYWGVFTPELINPSIKPLICYPFLVSSEHNYRLNCKKYEDIFEKEMENYWGEYWRAISEVDHNHRVRFDGFFNYLTDYVDNQKYLADVFIKL